MTFLEKAMEIDEKEGRGQHPNAVIRRNCPFDYGLEEGDVCIKEGEEKCFECWNREMPNTEPKVEVIPQAEVDAWYNAHESGKAEGYEQGLNDAWELAKKIVLKAEKGGLNYDDFKKIFDVGDYVSVLEELTPQEALEKLKAYEDSKNRVQVGDVIKTPVGNAVVTYVREEEYIAITSSGAYVRLEGLVAKTGKHLDIQSILSQIGE